LTDDHYKNVKQLIDIASVIEKGAANGSMPAWQNRLIPNEIVLVSSYVANMRGKNLTGRPPEGEVIPPWPAEPTETPSADAASEEEEPTTEADSADEASTEAEPTEDESIVEPAADEEAPTAGEPAAIEEEAPSGE
jgi:hypothetical protein